MRHLPTLFLAAVCMGCNTLGPKTIQGARFDYNEAIVRSWNQQLLLNIVRLHYRDTPQFLEVGEITTKHSLRYNAGLSGSFDDPGAEGVSSSLGIAYSEEPVVSYTPLQGEKFVKQMLAPIPLDAVLLLTQSGWSIDRVFRLCVHEINGVFNAPSASGPTPDYAPEYKKFHAFSQALRELQIIRAVELVAAGDQIALNLRADRLETAAANSGILKNVQDVSDVLHFDKVSNRAARIAVLTPEHGNRIATRSLLGVLHYMSQAVETPQAHRDAGKVTITTTKLDGKEFKWHDVTGDLMHIRSSGGSPEDAFVQVRYRGAWFYIDDADLPAKSTFGLLSNLLSLQSGEVKAIATVRTISL